MRRNSPQLSLRLSPEFRDQIDAAAAASFRSVNAAVNSALEAWLQRGEAPSDARIRHARKVLTGPSASSVRLEEGIRETLGSQADRFGISMHTALVLALEEWLLAERSGAAEAAGGLRLDISFDLQARIASSAPGRSVGEIIAAVLEETFPDRSREEELADIIQAAGFLRDILPEPQRGALAAACATALANAQSEPAAADLRSDVIAALHGLGEDIPRQIDAKDLRLRARSLWVNELQDAARGGHVPARAPAN